MENDTRYLLREWVPHMANSSHQIRLLTLPRRILRNGVIKLDLKTYSLACAPSYIALSYTWGCPFTEIDLTEKYVTSWEKHNARFTVMCNGQEVEVGQNLMEALQHLVPRYPNCQLWVDALCIDQQDESERHQQVNLMGEIYSSSALVAVWLGVSDDNTQSLALLYRIFHEVGQSSWSEDGDTNRKKWSRLLGDNEVEPTFSAGARGAVVCLHGRNWWTRKWTFQECVLNKSRVMILGDFSFDFEVLYEFFLHMVRFVDLSSNIYSSDISVLMDAISKISLINSWCADIKEDTSIEALRNRLNRSFGAHSFPTILMSLLESTADRTATEPRDTIWSVIGLSRMIAKRLDKPVGSISFDPLAPFEEYFASVAKYIYLGVPSLVLLESCGYGNGNEAWPSWVPDFQDLCPDFSFEVIKAPALAQATNCYHNERQFRAFKNFHESGLERELFGLRAVRVGVIRWGIPLPMVAYGLETVPDMLQYNWELLKRLLYFCQTLPTENWEEIGRREQIWRAFLGMSNFKPLISVMQTWAKYMLALAFLAGAVEPPGDDRISGSSVTEGPSLWTNETALTAVLGFDIISKAIKLSLDMGSAERILYTIKTLHQFGVTVFKASVCLLFISENRIGVTPGIYEEKDEVWILEGGRVPFILRSTAIQGQFRLVGTAYVDDIMGDEFIRDRGNDPGWEEIWLV